MATPTLSAAAEHLARLLSGGQSTVLADPSSCDLEFAATVVPRLLRRGPAPAEAWAVDGGQATVADARCVQLVVTRAAQVCFAGGECVTEREGELRAWLLGTADDRAVAASLGWGISAEAAVDVNLLRDHAEWEAVAATVEEARPGALVLVDGDLQADWRIPPAAVDALFARAAERGVTLAGVVKHSSLSRGGVPLLGQLEIEAAAVLGPRALWWAPVARSRPGVRPEVAVVVARLDPDARFAFRVDLPAGADAERVLGALSALCDDAAFPGYPYPLSVADRVAACPRWVRDEVWLEVEDRLDAAGVPVEVRERAFTDRHRLMERA